MRKILVPFDGSENAGRAVNYAISVAKEDPQAEIHLLQVVDPSQLATNEGFWQGSSKVTLLADGERTLQPALERFEGASLAYQSAIAFGSPGNEIAAYARDKGCTSIVMGSRGLSPIASFFVGSVAQRVVHLAEVPVTLVK